MEVHLATGTIGLDPYLEQRLPSARPAFGTIAVVVGLPATVDTSMAWHGMAIREVTRRPWWPVCC